MQDDPLQGEVIEHKRVRQRHSPLRGRTRIGLNITAMIDVVFLLLVYFMVATNFKLGEEIFRMDLPERGQAAAADPFRIDMEPLRVIVHTTADGGYRVQVQGPLSYEPTSFDDLYQFLRQRMLGPGRPGGLFEQDHPLIIEPAERAQWDHAIGAFNSAVRAEYTNVSFRSAG